MSPQSEPRYKIGDRVARTITARNNLALVIGWRRGEITGVRIDRGYAGHIFIPFYTVRWDGDSADSNGYWEGGLIPESEIS